jgi:hypothetical protein
MTAKINAYDKILSNDELTWYAIMIVIALTVVGGFDYFYQVYTEKLLKLICKSQK